MLSREQQARIEEHFRDENLWLLNTYCSDMDVDRVYRARFKPREARTGYSSMTDIDLIYRCLGIILEWIAFNEGSSPHDPKRQSSAEPFRSKGE